MKLFAEKYITAAQAVSKIKKGNRVVTGHASAEPQALLKALVQHAPNIGGIETLHLLGVTGGIHCAPELAGHIRHNSLFLGAGERSAIHEGRGDFTPSYFYRVPYLFSSGKLPIDVALVQVSPPDQHGYVSLGVAVDYTLEAFRCAKIKIAQVNHYMPRCHGDGFIHISEFDWLVEEDIPLPEIAAGEMTPEEQEIGKHCAGLIQDGDTLQLGIGAVPDAVLLCLKDKKDLGIHTELFSDGVIDLVNAGVITGRRKTLHPDKLVSTFVMGTRKLYDFVDDNPGVLLKAVDYTNDPNVIALNDNMVSVNSCVQVDLFGQVCSESIGTRQISGVGGQVDFVRGATLSKGGRSIIAITSTAKNGTVSKIVPFLDPGMAVTTSRCDVMYIVTEFGAANLQGKCLRERAKLLIDIAHPNFRAALMEEWERRFNAAWPVIND